jgi:hypothetical protein
MNSWPVHQRILCVKAFIRTGSIIEVQRQFRRDYDIPRRGRIPTRNIILQWNRRFNESGNLNNVYRGTQRRVRTPENIERVRQAVLRSPRRSAVRQATALNLSDRSIRRILHVDLGFHPYKIQMVQELRPLDFPARLQFCRDFLALVGNNRDVLNNLIMSDEAHFHLTGSVNKQNMRYWSVEQPHEKHERPLHSERVTVWCGVSVFGILGPYFFEEEGRTVTVNSQRYLAMIDMFVPAELHRLGRDIDNNELWFQQDGATSHTARMCMTLLRRMFPGRLVSRNGDVNWPARSPDLTCCDFFLWGYLKSKVFVDRPHTLQELKNNITNEIRAIGPDVLHRVMQSFRSRLQECERQEGAHMSNIIFKK